MSKRQRFLKLAMPEAATTIVVEANKSMNIFTTAGEGMKPVSDS